MAALLESAGEKSLKFVNTQPVAICVLLLSHAKTPSV